MEMVTGKNEQETPGAGNEGSTWEAALSESVCRRTDKRYSEHIKIFKRFFFVLFLAKIDSKRVASNLAERKDLQKDLILYSSKAVQNEGLL